MYDSLEKFSEDLITTKEVCALLHISRAGLYYRIRKCSFPKQVTTQYFSRTEILKWLEENRCQKIA